MGFVSEELNETEKQLIRGGKASNVAVVYGKEASIWKVSTLPLPGSPPPQLWMQKRSHCRDRKQRSLIATEDTQPGGCEPAPLGLCCATVSDSFIEDCDLAAAVPRNRWINTVSRAGGPLPGGRPGCGRQERQGLERHLQGGGPG